MNKKEKKYITNGIDKQLHVGNMLHDLYKKRRIFQSALARKMNRRYETVFKYQKKSTIQVAILWELSHALKHNFFYDIANMLPAEYDSTVIKDTTLDNEIVMLKEQIKILTIERDFAIKMINK
jgi:hypothetical protein